MEVFVCLWRSVVLVASQIIPLAVEFEVQTVPVLTSMVPLVVLSAPFELFERLVSTQWLRLRLAAGAMTVGPHDILCAGEAEMCRAVLEAVVYLSSPYVVSYTIVSSGQVSLQCRALGGDATLIE
jgi:hypothetical protein